MAETPPSVTALPNDVDRFARTSTDHEADHETIHAYLKQLASDITSEPSKNPNLPYYITAAIASQARPTWAGPVVWTCIYSPFSAPTNAINGDHVIDASGS